MFTIQWYLWGHRRGTWQQIRWTPSQYSSPRPHKLSSDTPIFLHERRNRELHQADLDLERHSTGSVTTWLMVWYHVGWADYKSDPNQVSVTCVWCLYLHRSRGYTWCFQSLLESSSAQRSTAEARWTLLRPAQCSEWWLYPEPPAQTEGGRSSPLLCLWSPLSPGLDL